MTSFLLRPLLLNNGHLMPRIGIGTFALKGDICQEIVNKAVQVGYRHIDTAQGYENEQDVGAALYAIERNGLCKRDDIFITTKLSNVYMNPRDVQWSLEESLEKLKSKYVNMFLVHCPWGLKNHGNGNLGPTKSDGSLDFEHYNMQETWKAMEILVKSGLTKSIGLSNFTESQMNLILSSAVIKPQNVQLECHAYFQQDGLRKFLTDNDISCTAYSPLGATGMPDMYKSPENESVVLIEDPVVMEIAEKYNVTPAVVLLSFLLQMNLIVIPKTKHLSRVEENMKVLEFELDDRDFKTIRSCDRNIRHFAFTLMHGHPEFTKTGEPF